MTAVEIEAAAQRAGLQTFAPGTAARFETYLGLLLKWNAKLNLTAIREPEDILQRHFLECIFAAQQLPPDIKTLLDFGSGGGFPGIPIALCCPEIHVTLGESQSKKAAFLREAVRTLNLSNATVYGGRVEALRQEFDAVALRAVDKMREACREAVEKVASEGYLILFVTKDLISPLVTEFAPMTWAEPLPLPNSDQRILLVGRKTADVPRGTTGA
jgi:16S rRNA (guanine527-N7)-methyltransferase